MTARSGQPISRRALLKGGAVAGAALGGGLLPGFMRRALAVAGGGPGHHRVLAFLFLRGAMDGLEVVSPHGEPRFSELRPTLALPAPGEDQKSDLGPGALLDIGAPGFGMHPSLEPLLPLWREGTLAFVHAVGSPDGTRSHFDAQDFLELGTPGVKGTRDGWMARAVAEAPGKRSALEAIAVAQRLPRSLQGDAAALAFASLDQLRLRPMPGAPAGAQGRTLARQTFEALYDIAPDGPVAASGKEAFAAVEMLERKLSGRTFRPGEGGYPAAPIGQSPARRATFTYALPLCGLIGSLISVSISAGPTTVSYGPVWNARADTSRLPSRPWMIMEPFSAANAADRSSDGSAWQRDPPMVPQFLTTGSAITRSASCKIAK